MKKHRLVIYEKNKAIGGRWLENKYSIFLQAKPELWFNGLP